jgi:hypothetical protein
LKPEQEDLEKIQKKLKSGLPALAKAAAPKRIQQVQRPEQPRKRAETRTAPVNGSVPQ